MIFKKNWPVVTSVATLCIAVSGCGGDSDTDSSSTNDTEQQASTQNNSAYCNNGDTTKSSGQGRNATPPSNWSSNRPPVADITASSHTFMSGETVTLDASDSFDEDSDDLKFFWMQVKGPRIELNNTSEDTLTFVAPEVTKPTQFVFLLFLRDGISADITGYSMQVSPLSEDTPPLVTHRYPEADHSGVPISAEISVTFNEALLESSVDDTSLVVTTDGKAVPGSVSYDDVTHSIIFRPDTELVEEAQYQVTLGDSIQDIAGNVVTSDSWTFSTKGASTDDGDDPKDDNGDDPKDDNGDDPKDDNGDDPKDDNGDDPKDDNGDDPKDDNGDDSNDDGGNNSAYNLGPTSRETINNCMNNADKEMLTLVNNARAQTRSCGGMSYQPAPALAWNCRLENAGVAHSSSMAENGFFSHTGQDGSDPGDRISAAGYNWSTYGENIAAGYKDAQTVMDGWLTSPGHCANIMNSSFTEVGVGLVKKDSGSYSTYWTQDFAAPR
jgi:uncharacterized protein YkwD